jgi:hypothetical protein
LLESDAGFRLRELHALFLSEFDRCAHDNAVRLLKQIAKETRTARTSVPAVPTADVTVRLGYWRAMYDRARRLHLMDRAMELLEHMRREDTQRGVAA